MKSNLRIGEAYVLSKIYYSLLAVTTIMCLYAVKQVSAQEAEPAATAVADVKPLQIGDTIPEYLWHLPLQIVNHLPTGGKDTMTLNDHRDKLIILDFWATWCKPCISSLYKLDTLQKQFADELAVIPTTYEAKEKAGAFIANKGWSLPSAVGDTILKKYFPHQSIPHQIWIKSGRVEAIAGSEYANREYISKALAGGIAGLKPKIEVDFDASKPLFLNGNGGDGTNMLSQSVISGQLQARVSGVSRQEGAVMAYNATVEKLYKVALENSPLIAFNNNRYFAYDVHDTLRYRISANQVKREGNRQQQLQWSQENLYCYNLVLPKGSGKALMSKRMLRDLNDFFGQHLHIKVSVETRQVTALAVVKTEDFKDVSTKGGESLRKWDSERRELILQNQPLSSLLTYMNTILDYRPRLNLEPYNYPIVDETGIVGNVDLELGANFSDIESVRKALSKYGLSLVEKVSPVKLIVFSDNQQPNH